MKVLNSYADVAELVDAHDSKSCGKPCGFESHHRYHLKSKKIVVKSCFLSLQRFLFLKKRWQKWAKISHFCTNFYLSIVSFSKSETSIISYSKAVIFLSVKSEKSSFSSLKLTILKFFLFTKFK